MDDHRDGEYEDTYKCENCSLVVTYVTKDDDVREYHEYRDGEIEVQLELFTSGFETNQAYVLDFLNDVINAAPSRDEHDGYSGTLMEFAEEAKRLKTLLNTDNPSSEG
jgi:hypothetical protein